MNITRLKTQFPIFKHHPKLVYLDSAATSQKPARVINRIKKFYEEECANIHRGIYQLSEQATQEYEAAREKAAEFIGAKSSKEIIFTSGTTESINLVASAWGRANIKEDDEIVVTEAEHHSNIVPWQGPISNLKSQISKPHLKSQIYQSKIFNNIQYPISHIQFIPITKDGELDISQLSKLITKKTKIVALTYISNVLGVINPVAEIAKKVKKINPNCLVLIDAAQAVPHLPVNVQDLGCDFLAFSGHKMLGPTGVGVLWAREKLLEEMDPYQFGGGMILKVDQYQSKWAKIPQKFEAGTPNIAGVIGLGAAIDFLREIGMEKICHHEEELTAYALERLLKIPELTIYGSQELEKCGCVCGKCKNRLGIISFNIAGIHAHDAAQVLDSQNIAVRAGHHCAQPLHQNLGISASVRASFYLYNNHKDVDRLVKGIGKIKQIFK
jgi:cysteine desulfurase/selenocysteine lyase